MSILFSLMKCIFFSISLIWMLFAVNGQDLVAQLPDKVQTDDFDKLSSRIASVIPNVVEGHPGFLFINNESKTVVCGLANYWNDPREACDTNFECISIGHSDNSSLQLSTSVTDNYTWSWIFGGEIGVKPGERYELITHMKVNDFAQESFVALEGYNQSTGRWDTLMTHCPENAGWIPSTGTFVPPSIEWEKFACEVIVPSNTSHVRPVLNAGWSLSSQNNATTWFGPIYLSSLDPLESDTQIISVTYSHASEDSGTVVLSMEIDERSQPHPLFFLFPR